VAKAVIAPPYQEEGALAEHHAGLGLELLCDATKVLPSKMSDYAKDA
jgi:hypothetical protein